MKPYAVEVSFTMIVMADDEEHAEIIADNEAREAWYDTSHKDFKVHGQVLTEDDLRRHKWDGFCIPYGGDGNTRLSEILANPT